MDNIINWNELDEEIAKRYNDDYGYLFEKE